MLHSPFYVLNLSEIILDIWLIILTCYEWVTGEHYAHIFLLYVTPEHRRQGIAKVLLQLAETQAQARGDRQIGLQVFLKNTAARQLYQNWGFQEQSLLLLKRIGE
jgi:ribosomal protein S18 acetylase RimI-like enzyme